MPSDSGPQLILASQSPRRRELLGILGIAFDVIPADIAEVPQVGESPEQFVVRAAREKGIEVASRSSNAVILSADTIVTIDGRILGKPLNESDAVRMLMLLSGHRHEVYTAVCVIDQIHAETFEGFEKTRVWFNSMTEAQALEYVRREPVLDKAGSYAIQGFAQVYISKIEGNYSNVMGLPLPLVCELLTRSKVYF